MVELWIDRGKHGLSANEDNSVMAALSLQEAGAPGCSCSFGKA